MLRALVITMSRSWDGRLTLLLVLVLAIVLPIGVYRDYQHRQVEQACRLAKNLWVLTLEGDWICVNAQPVKPPQPKPAEPEPHPEWFSSIERLRELCEENKTKSEACSLPGVKK